MEPHNKLMLIFIILLFISGATLLPDVAIALLSVVLAVGINLILFHLLRPFDKFEVDRIIDRTKVSPPADLNTTISLKYNGRFPATANISFECRSLNLVVNTGTSVFTPGQNFESTFAIKADKRGVHKLSNTVVNVRDWLMLSGRKLEFDNETEILVLPHVYPFGTLTNTATSSALGVTSSIKRGRSSEIWGIREYQPGDDYKIIAWKAMAKSPDHKPKSRITAGEMGPAISIVLDVGQDMGLPNEDDINLDVAADLAASITYNFTKEGTRTGLIFFDNRTRNIIKPSKGEEHLDNVLRNLALAVPSSDKFLSSTLSSTQKQFSAEFGRTLIVISSRLDDKLFSNYMARIKAVKDLLLIIVHNDENQSSAEILQKESTSKGIKTIVTNKANIQNAIKEIEVWSSGSI
tara:strand:- start:164 stop:1384 length:1221 start_codon:yes stop_codon:yes gene_type:complete